MQLTVKPLREENVRRGLAAVDLAAMSHLGLLSGEHAEVKGPSGSVRPRVWPAYADDEGSKVIRLDADHRRQLGTEVDGIVEITPTDIDDAEALLVGVPNSHDLTESLGRTVRDHLVGCVVGAGDTVATPTDESTGEDRIAVRIAGTRPDGPVSVTDSTTMKMRTYQEEDEAEPTEEQPDTTYGDVGGLDDELARVRELVELPLRDPSPFAELGVDPPSGVLLHGPPGTGKTLLARAVADETGMTFVSLSGPEVMSRYYGESEEQLREVFEHAEENEPAVIFIDEIDAIAPERSDASGDVERRVVAQLLTLMDGIESSGDVVVLAATNRPEAIDPALRRGGRFDREIEISVPDREARLDILRIHAREMPLGPGVDLGTYADRTHGFVGADLASLTREAAMHTLERVESDGKTHKPGSGTSLQVTEADFRAAFQAAEPSALRELFVEVPDVTWDDVGGLGDVKRDLREAVEWPLSHPDVLDRAGIDTAMGVLLYGPPGTGKTMLARAAASESDCNLISVKGPELLSKWVGESEQGVRELFERARENSPAIVLFDEIDAIASERGQDRSSGVGERMVGQMLTELDGVEPLEDVLVVATTNRPDMVDDALLRPGRLDRQIHVPAPDRDARREIFDVHSSNSPVGPGVDFDQLARRTEGYVGADVAAICREAATVATREFLEAGGDRGGLDNCDLVVTADHFEAAIESVSPSVSTETCERHAARDGRDANVERLDAVDGRGFE